MRLLAPVEFERTFATGKRIRNDVFKIIASANGRHRARLGLAISRRCAARAVDRNRIKRVVRENFRVNAPTLGSIDIVVQATARTRTRSSKRLSRELDDLWARLS